MEILRSGKFHAGLVIFQMAWFDFRIQHVQLLDGDVYICNQAACHLWEISLDLALDPGIRGGAVKSVSEGCGHEIIESLMQLGVDGTDLRP